MVKRHNNQLPDNIYQLQNLLKRDPQSYKDEFNQQQQHYQSLMTVFLLRPDQPNKQLNDLVLFMAQVAHCFPEALADFAQQLINVLQTHSTVLHPSMRMNFCRALILLRNKNLLAPNDLLPLFFQLLKCQDKNLRKFLETHIINDIKNLNARHKNAKLNTSLQNFMYGILKDNNAKAAKMSVNIMIELYKKNVWNDAKTVNVIATACFSKVAKVMVAALKFFIGTDPADDKKSDDSDSDDEPTLKDVMFATRVNKKTRKREKEVKKAKKLEVKNQKEKSDAPTFNFSALHLIHDPQGFAEKLFRQLEATHERFEVRLMTLDVISRLIGVHQLIVLNFYPYVQRFLQPHQKEVVQLLQFVAQASHEFVPPDALEPVLKTLVNNFVTERNSSDVMAIGINAVRELCTRCPLVMNEDLLRDLADYKNYREKSVSMAAKSLIHLYRITMPELLHKRDRGKPTEAAAEIQSKKFGEVVAKSYIPGAEVLLEKDSDAEGGCGYDSDSSGEWIDVSDDDESHIKIGDGTFEEEEEDEEEEEEGEDEEDEDDDDEEEGDESCDDEEEEGEKSEKKEGKRKGETGAGEGAKSSSSDNKKPTPVKQSAKARNEAILAEKKQQAAEISVNRILTDEDFLRIDAAQLKKKMESVKRGVKRPHEQDVSTARNELVPLSNIEMIHKKRKNDKQARIESIRKGQEGREKFGYKDGRVDPFSSKTNREKKKTKNFMMIRHKARGKIKRSFKDKQIALRNYLVKQKKMR
ncbi:protein SDA1 homolog [Nilaparvata lugens]|uniref:protein SDA1 homolog n=1 Tax=Nilaparvata lugens TaxID=108931 RepID=UPI00193E8A58|nr:protein SDA1 homolog [Nilaparvata lugens]